jgi:hypothetical protein
MIFFLRLETFPLIFVAYGDESLRCTAFPFPLNSSISNEEHFPKQKVSLSTRFSYCFLFFSLKAIAAAKLSVPSL